MRRLTLWIVLLIVSASAMLAAAQDPDLPSPDVERCLTADDYSVRVDACTEAIRVEPENADLFSARANAHYMLGDYEAALDNYHVSIRLNPNDALTYHSRGSVRHALGQWNFALADFDRAIQFNSAFVDPHMWRGDVYFQQGYYDQAIQSYTQAIERAPNHAIAYGWRGYLYLLERDYDLALVDFNRALQLNPINAFSLVNRGYLYLQISEYQHAVDDITASIALNDGIEEGSLDLSGALVQRAVAFAELQDYQAALDDIDRALEFDAALMSTLPGVNFYYAAVLFMLEDDAAYEALSDVIDSEVEEYYIRTAYRLRAQIQWWHGDEAAARRDLERASEPGNGRVLVRNTPLTAGTTLDVELVDEQFADIRWRSDGGKLTIEAETTSGDISPVLVLLNRERIPIAMALGDDLTNQTVDMEYVFDQEVYYLEVWYAGAGFGGSSEGTITLTIR